MRATVKISEQGERSDGTNDTQFSEINIPVRLGMQGYGSVELYVEALSLWPRVGGPAPTPQFDPALWLTLGTVIEHPAVRNVTFR